MKNKLTIIVAAVIVLLVAAICVLGTLVHKFKTERDDTRIELGAKTDTLKTFVDKNGVMVAQIDQYGKTVGELKYSMDSIEKRLYEEMRLSKIKNRQIETLMYALMNSSDSLKIALNDTMFIIQNLAYSKYGVFNNGHLSEEIYIQSDCDSAIVNYKYVTQLFMYESWYRPASDSKFLKWLKISFKKKRQQFTFKSDDPNAEIEVLRSIVIDK